MLRWRGTLHFHFSFMHELDAVHYDVRDPLQFLRHAAFWELGAWALQG